MSQSSSTQQPIERPFTMREVALPLSAPNGSDGRVKIYHDQQRTFTYLETTLMNDQQKNLSAPFVCQVHTFQAGPGSSSTWRRVPLERKPVERTSLDKSITIREITPGDVNLFAAQRKLSYEVYSETRGDLEKLNPKAQARLKREDAVIVREEYVLPWKLGVKPAELVSEDVNMAEDIGMVEDVDMAEDGDVAGDEPASTAGHASRPWEL